MDLEGKMWVSRVINYNGSFSLFRGDDDIPMAGFRVSKMVSAIGTLHYIRELFNAGTVTLAGNRRAHYDIYNPFEIQRSVVPLIDTYPLKNHRKNRQYKVWRSGIAMLCRVNGSNDKWSDKSLRQFDVIAHNLLRKQRVH